MKKFPITKSGFKKLEQEIKHLKQVERPKVIEAVAVAREFGDLSENAEYLAARELQGFIEGRILELEDKIARSEIIDISKLSGPSIKFGATVSLKDNDINKQTIVTYQIVSEYEVDINEGKISINSPIAKALIGKSAGDLVEVVTPKDIRSYIVIDVKYIEIN